MQRDFEAMNNEAKADAYYEARDERRKQDEAEDAARHGRVMTAFENPPIPVRAWDWSAWIDGREEWLTGRGRTEAEAIADLLEQADEAQDAPAARPVAREIVSDPFADIRSGRYFGLEVKQ
jgi:hypothetical protein